MKICLWMISCENILDVYQFIDRFKYNEINNFIDEMAFENERI